MVSQNWNKSASKYYKVEMPKRSSNDFRRILKNDRCTYVVKSKHKEPIDINCPNLPTWHKEEFEEWRHEILPDANVVSFEYNGSEYKLLINMGDGDCNDGSFGALFDANNEKVLDVISSGDMESTIDSLKDDDVKIGDDLRTGILPYLEFFAIILRNSTELEYLVFKVMVENKFLFEIDDIDDRDGE